MYGEKLSVAGFFGSIPDIVSDDGDHQYTIDKKKAYAEYPDTRAIAPAGPLRRLDPRRREDGQRHQC